MGRLSAGGSRAQRQWDAIRAFALGLPGAVEDFPWGTPVIKVAATSKWPRLFVWLGGREQETLAIYVKLTHSYEQAVAVANATPTTISGVGRYGRLTIQLPVDDLDLLLDWVEESYRIVAPKRLVVALDRERDRDERARGRTGEWSRSRISTTSPTVPP